jgi:hypothetical protein
MVSDDILLFLLPIELLSFKLSHLLDLFTLVSKSSVGLIIDSLQIWNVTLTFCLGVIVNFKRSLTSEEVRISLWMKLIWNLFSIKGTSDYVCDLWLIIFIIWACLIESTFFGSTHSFRVSMSSLTLSSDPIILSWQIAHRVSWNGFSLKYIVTIIVYLSVKSFLPTAVLVSKICDASVWSIAQSFRKIWTSCDRILNRPSLR